MSWGRDAARRTGALIGVAAIAAAVATTAAAGASGGGSPVIKSGAGPGWPQTLTANDFVSRVDNPWFPLEPGSRYHYEGAEDGTKMTDDVHVTDRTKSILGVDATAVHDVVSVHGVPREVTDDWYAQDTKGNVWYFGERTRELDPDGNVTSREGSFKAGRDGARAGVYMAAHPKVGVTARQEYYKGHASDRFRVVERGADVTVPALTSDDALRTQERTHLEPNVIDNKFYVRGIGSVRELTVKGGSETLELVSVSGV